MDFTGFWNLVHSVSFLSWMYLSPPSSGEVSVQRKITHTQCIGYFSCHFDRKAGKRRGKWGRVFIFQHKVWGRKSSRWRRHFGASSWDSSPPHISPIVRKERVPGISLYKHQDLTLRADLLSPDFASQVSTTSPNSPTCWKPSIQISYPKWNNQ